MYITTLYTVKNVLSGFGKIAKNVDKNKESVLVKRRINKI
jgi:hypothetical protein